MVCTDGIVVVGIDDVLSRIVLICIFSKSFAPEYETAAGILKGVVKVAALDATAHEKAAQNYGIKGFPTVKVFGADKKNPVDFQGQRTSDAVVSEAMKAANALVKDRKRGGGKGKDKPPKGEKKEKPKGKKSGGKAVVTLTEADFEEQVLQSTDHWLVEFYAPWCGHWYVWIMPELLLLLLLIFSRSLV